MISFVHFPLRKREWTNGNFSGNFFFYMKTSMISGGGAMFERLSYDTLSESVAIPHFSACTPLLTLWTVGASNHAFSDYFMTLLQVSNQSLNVGFKKLNWSFIVFVAGLRILGSLLSAMALWRMFIYLKITTLGIFALPSK